MANFSERLKLVRKAHKASQKQLSEVIEVSETQYQNYEYGKHLPTIDKLEKLCTYFNVSADYLLGLSDNPERR